MSFSMAGRGARGPEINVTPLIDVLLTLIIVFMVVVSMDKEQGETAQIPQPDQKQTANISQPSTVVIQVVWAKEGQSPTVKINQDAKLFVALLSAGEAVTQSLGAKRYAWLQVAKGEVELNGKELHQGDGAAISEERKLTIKATEDAEVLLFDLA